MSIKNYDWIWDSVIEALARRGIVIQFQNTPAHELQNIHQLYLQEVWHDLVHVYTLTRAQDLSGRALYFRRMGDKKLICLMAILSRSMKVWAESESEEMFSIARKWPVAHA